MRMSKLQAWGAATLILVSLAWTASSTQTVPSAPKCQAEPLLCDLLPDSGKDRRVSAIEQIARREDRRFIAPLLDLLRFIKNPQEYTQAIIALNRLTGKDWSNS